MAAPALPPPERTSHPFYMHDMIFQIPESIRETLRRIDERSADLASRSRDRSSLVFTGCGTAFFAAMLARAAMPTSGGGSLHSLAVQAFELPRYAAPTWAPSTVVGLSNSGITKPTVDALRAAREGGAFTVGLTHYDGRPIQEAAEETVVIGNGPDKSRCHTKCYVAGSVAGAELGWSLLRHRGQVIPHRQAVEGLRELPALIETLARSAERDAERLAGTYRKARDFYFVGAGPNEATALEAALKMKESSFVHAEGMELEQMLHGPWLALDRGSVLVAIAPRGLSRDRALDALRAAQNLGVQTVAVATEGDHAFESVADVVFPIPEVDEYLSAFLAIVPLYLFAYHSAVKRANNPDYLRYLDPVWWEARGIVFPPGTH